MGLFMRVFHKGKDGPWSEDRLGLSQLISLLQKIPTRGNSRATCSVKLHATMKRGLTVAWSCVRLWESGNDKKAAAKRNWRRHRICPNDAELMER